jgi:hypothetical protein
MPREQFRDSLSSAAGGLPTYQWEINHSEESANEQTRSIEDTANTAGTGYVRQQGTTSPEIRRWSGTILTKTQYDAMQDYYAACSSRTIFLTDFTGEEREVVITSFNPTRKRTVRNPRDASIPLHYWTYEITMEVIA